MDWSTPLGATVVRVQTAPYRQTAVSFVAAACRISQTVFTISLIQDFMTLNSPARPVLRAGLPT